MNVGELKFEVSEDVKALILEPKLKLMIQAFKQLDSNQDGKIGLDEFLDLETTAHTPQLAAIGISSPPTVRSAL